MARKRNRIKRGLVLITALFVVAMGIWLPILYQKVVKRVLLLSGAGQEKTRVAEFRGSKSRSEVQPISRVLDTPEEISPVAMQAEDGDLHGAVAAYRKQYDPATLRGLVALRQLAIQALRAGLRNADPHERNVIATILGRFGDPGALWVLDEAIHSDEPMLRRTAADALGDLATPGAVCILRRLYDSDLEGKRLALSGLRRTGDKTAVLCYLDAVAQGDESLRAQGLGGLGESRVQDILPSLRQFLKTEKDPLISVTLAHALASVGDPDGYAHLRASLTIDQQEQVRDSVVGLLGALEDDARVVPLLHKAFLDDPSVTVRTTAAASLAHFRDPSGLPLLQQALNEVDYRIRLGVAVSFSRMDYATAKPLVLKGLESEDPLVRTHALKVIGENSDRSLAQKVAEAVDHEKDRYVKSQALWTLGKVGDVKNISLMMDLLMEAREEVRDSAAEALVLLSDRLLQRRGNP